ncbi:hypothetical protein SLEP1_g54411 [Rubroshorea leprosula]|uniref:Uncharacterized protein n=1 Tax=Rubroshorea leprosula TaxID=152421 RepID=A0AAV5MCJ2_9ROSI|nr:hypothetical protein SLEP1_g54411 [Rubroshorea leprosula]
MIGGLHTRLSTAFLLVFWLALPILALHNLPHYKKRFMILQKSEIS